MWAKDLRETQDLELLSERNPSIKQEGLLRHRERELAGRPGEYLRGLGALDETDPKKPTGVFPKLHGQPQIGRSNDWEGLLRHLERELAGRSERVPPQPRCSR